MEKRATTQNFLAEPCITLTIGLSYTYRGYYHYHLVPVCFIHYIMPPAPYLYSKIGVHIFKMGLVVILTHLGSI